jgi:hypothetical protein
MKTIYYLLAFALSTGILNENFAATAGQDTPVIIVSQNRVHLLMDETPDAPVVLQLRDAAGRVWHTHTFTLESEYWYTELPALPAGEYGVYVGEVKSAGFSKKASDAAYFVKKPQSK